MADLSHEGLPEDLSIKWKVSFREVLQPTISPDLCMADVESEANVFSNDESDANDEDLDDPECPNIRVIWGAEESPSRSMAMHVDFQSIGSIYWVCLFA